MSNNLYNILAAFNAATKPEEAATPKQQAKAIYESVEAKGSIMGSVKGVEKKLAEAFAAHKEQVSELSIKTLSSYGNKAEKDSAKHLSKAAKLTDKAYSQYNKGGATADKSWDTIDKAEKHVDKSDKREAGMDRAASKLGKKFSKGVAEGKMSDLDYELNAKEVSDAEFKKKYGKSKADMRKSMSGKKADKKTNEAAGDDIPWYDRPDDGPETTDTETGRVHRAGKGGYGNKYDDDVPTALPAGQVARGRGRPKGLPALLRAQKAAELAAKGIDPNAPRGRGRPKKSPAAGGADSAPQGTLGLHRFLFGPMPTKLPGKAGVTHKIPDTGTVKDRNAKITGEGLGDDFAALAKGMKNPDGTPRFTTVRQGPAPRKPASATPSTAPRSTGPVATSPADWYDQSTGGRRNMGDSKINRKASVTESAKSTLKGYLSESFQNPGSDAFGHILNRFRNEVKRFQAGEDMDDDLYDALFDYYLNSGEMPYGVAKARTGDPYEWVCQRFDQDMPMEEAVDPLTIPAAQRKAQGQAPLSLDQVRAPRADSISDKRNLNAANGNTKELDDLARLAGITTESVSVIGGDVESEMSSEPESKMNISTNQSSDGTKNVTVTADGEAAVALLDMLKNAGMGNSDAAQQQAVIISAQGDEHMGADCGPEEMEEEYANEPAPQYQSVEKITSAGDDMNRQKKQNFPLRAPGNNPMSEMSIDPGKSMGRDLMAEYQAMKLKK